jgi:hypothetical protein
VGAHAAGAAEFLGREKVAAFLGENDPAALSAKERAILALTDVAAGAGKSRVAAAPEICAAIDVCKSAGWSERAVYDAITVIALFNFYNAWVDCAGVEELDASGYAATGERLKKRGYGMVEDVLAMMQSAGQATK